MEFENNLNSPRPGPSISITGSAKKIKRLNNHTSRIRDPLLVARVNKFLTENSHKTIIDVHDVVDALQKRFREYKRRNWSQLKELVEKIIVQANKQFSMNMETESSSDVEECDRSAAVSITQPLSRTHEQENDSTIVNSARPSRKKDNNDMELINLSSDEEPNREKDNVAKPCPEELAKAQDRLILNPEIQITRNRKTKTQRGKKYVNNSVAVESTSANFSQFGGGKNIIEEVSKLILHMKYPEVFRQMGVTAPRGFLLHGPPGCGKTLLACAVAGELGYPLIKISGPELVGGVSGESEERIRDLFASAVESSPCVLFIDEVDAITPNRQTAQREMERRIVAQLITSLDDLSDRDEGGQVLVIGATKRPDSLDPALRRAGRFDREVCIGIPDEAARYDILKVLCESVKLSDSLDLKKIARLTPGFVGADLLSLIREAAMVAITRVFKEIYQEFDKKSLKRKLDMSEAPVAAKLPNNGDQPNNGEIAVEETNGDKMAVVGDAEVDVVGIEAVAENPAPVEGTLTCSLARLRSWIQIVPSLTDEQLSKCIILEDDLCAALKTVQPSAKREGFATVPDVTWDDVGSLIEIREHLKMTILGPIQYPEQFERLGLVSPAGVLLCGPPGCGKTLLAKALANEAGVNFISVKGPELLNMYVGESERAVRTVFQRARNSTPCVIFFDELDALCPRRSTGDSGAGVRVVNQMLTEMDGITERKGVFLMAATNRPDIVDPAILRPGRLDRTVYIGMPNADDRRDILNAITKCGTKPPLAEEVSIPELACRTELDNWTGADLAALMREAAMQAMREATSGLKSNSLKNEDICVRKTHIEQALLIVRPSVSETDLIRYEDLRAQFSVAHL